MFLCFVFFKPLFKTAKRELPYVLININLNWVNFSEAQNYGEHIGKAPSKMLYRYRTDVQINLIIFTKNMTMCLSPAKLW